MRGRGGAIMRENAHQGGVIMRTPGGAIMRG